MISPPPRKVSRFVLPIIAAGLFAFSVYAVIEPPRTRAAPPAPPPATSYDRTVAGIGIVEPEGELIAVASELPGVVRAVHVRVGERVARGAPLFTLDTRATDATIAQARAALGSARASANATEVALADERQRLSLFEAVVDRRALSTDEIARRRFAVDRAEAAVATARAAVAVAQADLSARRVERARATVASPITGRVYRIDVRPGEFAPAGPSAQPLMTVGADTRLNVRVEIDEADAGRFVAGAPASGRLRGAAGRAVPLAFVRVEPQVTDKRALSGGAERVDTRVVEAIYSFDPVATPAYLGQRMDVFVRADPAGRG